MKQILCHMGCRAHGKLQNMEKKQSHMGKQAERDREYRRNFLRQENAPEKTRCPFFWRSGATGKNPKNGELV